MQDLIPYLNGILENYIEGKDLKMKNDLLWSTLSLVLALSMVFLIFLLHNIFSYKFKKEDEKGALFREYWLLRDLENILEEIKNPNFVEKLKNWESYLRYFLEELKGRKKEISDINARNKTYKDFFVNGRSREDLLSNNFEYDIVIKKLENLLEEVKKWSQDKEDTKTQDEILESIKANQRKLFEVREKFKNIWGGGWGGWGNWWWDL